MDLLCCENSGECRAYQDPVLLHDDRVLRNLLKTEELYTANSSYFQCVQKELTPAMRKIVAEWMLEVCEEQKCSDEVFPLAMNYMDRYLALCPVAKNQLQLLGCVCLLIASKLREPRPLPAQTLVFYTDNSVSVEQIWGWELLVVTRLKWDLSAVTPQDFLGHIILRLPLDDTHGSMVRRHAQTFIALCARDYKFSMYTASMIAGASITAALHGLDWTSKPGCSLAELLDTLHRLLRIEKDYLHSCFIQIEEMVTATMNSTEANGVEKEVEHGKAETPTDVRDIHF